MYSLIDAGGTVLARRDGESLGGEYWRASARQLPWGDAVVLVEDDLKPNCVL